MPSVTATRLRLYFENATFERECFGEDSRRPAMEPWVVLSKNRDVGARLEAKMAEVSPHKAWFERQFELFHEAIVGNGAFPVTLDEARASIELITAMFHSDETGATVALPIAPDHPKYGGWIPASIAERSLHAEGFQR